MVSIDSRAELSSRPYCYRCFKPTALCLCGGTVVRNRTQIVILQHPRERQHPIGTERLARLGLANCMVHIAWSCTLSPELAPSGAALLYPSEQAREITELDAASRPTTLVVLDGTWSQARSLYKKNAWLAELPHVKLTQAPPSNYRIRREPRADYVSTIEALVHALRALEPETQGFDALLARFNRMVDDQLAYAARPPVGSYRHLRRGARALEPHPLLLDQKRSAVVGYVECASPRGSRGERLVQVCLERTTDGERLECFVRPTGDVPDDKHLANMGLTRDRLETGVSDSDAVARVRAFVRENDFLIVWSVSTLRALGLLAPWRDTLSLKAAYGNWTRLRPGDLEALPLRHGLAVADGHFSGRARHRMAAAIALTTWMQAAA